MPRKINQILLLLFTIFNCNVFAQVTPNKPSGVITKIAGSNLSCGSNWLSVQSSKASVTIGDLDITGNKLTIEATINRTQAFDPSFFGGDIVSKHCDPTDDNYLLRSNRAQVSTTNGAFITPGICDIELNKTYHIAMVYDGSTLKYYRNGFLLSQVDCSGTLLSNNYQTTIGTTACPQNPWPSDFVGFINEVRIWNIARTQNEIKQYMTQSLPNPATQSGLLAYYIFDDLKNKQGNTKWNGQLNNGASIFENNPTCDTYIADSCGTIPFIEPVVNAGFTIPDTVCVSTPININNTTTNGTNFYWNFCDADLNTIPEAINLGNPGNLLDRPVFMDISKDSDGNYYGLLINNFPGNLVRLDFGNNMLNAPTSFDLGNFGGIIPNTAEGIQIVKSDGKWLAIIVGGTVLSGGTPRILKIDFGASLSNPNPVATNWGNIGNLDEPIDLYVFQDKTNWYGFTVNSSNNSITRFNFGNNFENPPSASNLGSFGSLVYPTGIYAILDNTNWRVFITNAQSNAITRLDFGNSLLNIPTAVNLGNSGNTLNLPRDISILKSCSGIVGFVVNQGSGDIVKLDFKNGLDNMPIAASLGNIGSLSVPHSLSKLFRVDQDLYSFITNVGNNTITRLRFAGCTNSNIPNSSDSIPPTITYNIPGSYNINLLVDEGLSTQTFFCKNIVVVPAPVKSPVSNTAFCSGDSLTLKTSFTTGNYLWSTGSTDSLIDVNKPGSYWVESGYYGCSVRDSFTVLKNELPIVSIGKDTSICNADSIRLDAGNTATAYVWQDGSTGQTFNAKGSGTYSVTVTDANGCIGKDSAKIDLFGSIDLRLTNDTTICMGNQITLSANGNNIKLFNWSASATLSDSTIPNPVAGPTDTTRYFITVIDSNGCAGKDSVLVKVAPLPIAATIPDSAICAGNSLTLLTNASAGVTYTWSPSTGLSNTNSNNPVAAPVTNTVYVVTVTSTEGCISKDSVNISLKALPLITAFGDTTVCANATAQLQAISAGNTNFSWFPATALNNAFISSPVASATQTTKYYVQVTANNNCVNLDSVIVAVVPKPVFTIKPDVKSLCAGDTMLITATGGDTYQWSPSSTVLNPASASTSVFPTQNTVYKVVITNKVCNITDSVFAAVNINAKPNISITKSNDVDCVLGQTKLLATGGVQYFWSPAFSLNYANISNPVASPSESTSYHLFVTGTSGCIIEDSIMVNVIKGSPENGYLMPSAFTPNNDGLNDCFGVKQWGYITGLDFSVYNRWGNLVFHTTNASNCWDGRYKGVLQPQGAFVYQVRVKTICGEVYRKGTVVLIR